MLLSLLLSFLPMHCQMALAACSPHCAHEVPTGLLAIIVIVECFLSLWGRGPLLLSANEMPGQEVKCVLCTDSGLGHVSVLTPGLSVLRVCGIVFMLGRLLMCSGGWEVSPGGWAQGEASRQVV